MSNPQVQQTRRALTNTAGVQEFEVVTTVTDRGDLPYTELFVLTIVDAENPKSDVLARVATPHDIRQTTDAVYVKVDTGDLTLISGDTFARVASLTDLTTLPKDRVLAAHRGETEYLVASVSLTYADLATAIAAAQTLISRLSELTNEYRKFIAAFQTNTSQVYALPQGGVGPQDALTQAYRVARDARVAAEVVRDSAKQSVTTCQQLDAAAQDTLETLTQDVAFLEIAKAYVQTTATSDAKTFVLDGSDPRSYESMLVSKRAALTVSREAYTAQLAQCTALVQTLANAEATVVSAQRTEEAALAAVYSVCPTFDPTTV